MKEVIEEIGKERVDVVAVQEIRWQGQGRKIKKTSLSPTVDPKRGQAAMGQDLL